MCFTPARPRRGPATAPPRPRHPYSEDKRLSASGQTVRDARKGNSGDVVWSVLLNCSSSPIKGASFFYILFQWVFVSGLFVIILSSKTKPDPQILINLVQSLGLSRAARARTSHPTQLSLNSHRRWWNNSVFVIMCGCGIHHVFAVGSSSSDVVLGSHIAARCCVGQKVRWDLSTRGSLSILSKVCGLPHFYYCL